jgi:phosphoribosylformimino-5-aminoimidazole carboxamide ribotide isomerase
MKLIPVIDLMNGIAVTAKRGQRHTYQPSSTPLCLSSNPRAVLSALLRIYPFDTIYIADLDAIRGNGSNIDVIEKLRSDHRNLVFWVDNGLTDLVKLNRIARPVIGTESLITLEQLTHLLTSLTSPLLSLDYIDDLFKGPHGLVEQPTLWPDEVIIMTLSRVGSATGVDLAKLQQIKQKTDSSCRLYAAGGVRDQQDLERLKQLGISGVLLSTSLHQGSIGHREITAIVAD